MSAKKYPRVDTLKAIADYFGVTVDDLLKKRRTITGGKRNEGN